MWRWTVALHLVAVLVSIGYHQADEVVQTLQYAQFKVFDFDPSYMPWEYDNRMRPWLQPGLYALILAPAAALGFDDPFLLATVARLSSAVLSLTGLHVFLRGLLPAVHDRPHTAQVLVFATLLAWYVPFVDVRTSSVTVARALFMMWLGWLMLRRGLWPELLVGVLFGLSFQARYQVALMGLGVVIWLLCRRRGATALRVMLGGAAVMVLASGVDRWGYGEWAFPPWPYLAQNLLEDKVNTFGTLPWYAYFTWIMALAPPPLGPVLVLLAVWVWARHPLSLLSLSSWPLVLVHTLIGHKELRYVVVVAPIVVAAILVHTDLVERIVAFGKAHWPRAGRGVVTFLLVVNFVYMGVLLAEPRPPELLIYRAIWRRSQTSGLAANPADPGPELIALGGDPYDYGDYQMRFYRPPELKVREVSDMATLLDELRTTDRDAWVLLPFNWVPDGVDWPARCRVDWRFYPDALEALGLRPVLQGNKSASLHRCPAGP